MEIDNQSYNLSLIKEIEQLGCRCSTFFGCDIHSLCKRLRDSLYSIPVKIPYTPKNYCNLHSDCAEANRLAAENNEYVSHCNDDCCEDCFGN